MKRTFKKSLHFVNTGIAVVALSSCGTGPLSGESGKDTEKATGSTNGKENSQTGTGDINAPLVQQDEVVLGESINSQVEEAVASAVEELDLDSSSSALALTDYGFNLDKENSEKSKGKGIAGNSANKENETKNDMVRFRECVEDGNKAVVTMKHSFSHERNFERQKLKGITKSSFLQERTRSWSKEGAAVKCSPNKKSAAIAWTDLKGYDLAVSFKGEKSHEQTLTQLKKNVTMTHSQSRSNTGTRGIKWIDVVKDETNITLTKQVTNSSERKMSATNKKGETKSWESSVATVEGAPLMITVVRDAKTNELKTRTIKSGSIAGTAKDGTKIETKFENVVYERESRCNAVSGKLTGSISAKDATTPSVTFTVTFSGEEPSVEFSDGKTYELNIDGCEFEEEGAKVTEASKKDDVKDPGISK